MTEETKPTVRLAINVEGLRHYIVRNGWGWASVYIRPTSYSAEATGAEVMVNSDYGMYGFHWSHMGEDWRKFLPNTDFDYCMGKMAGAGSDGRFYTRMSTDEMIATFRSLIAEEKAEHRAGCDADEPNDPVYAERWRKLRTALYEIEQHHSDECGEPGAFFRKFDELAEGIPYSKDWWEVRLEKVNPQVRGFWDKLWLPLMEHIREEYRQEREAAGESEALASS